MADIEKQHRIYGVSRPSGAGHICSTAILFGNEPVNTNFTLEQMTSTIYLDYGGGTSHPDSLYMLAVKRPVGTLYPGDLTINTYNMMTIDGTTLGSALLTSHTIGSALIATSRCFLIQGLFVGSAAVQIGASYATDVATTMTVNLQLFRL